MAIVSVSGLSRSFGSVKALDNLSLTFDDGVFYALLGPSGSGKTTLLRMIAGFERPQSGQITMDGDSVENVAVEHRRIGMVFQNYALFPNMSVEDNVAFGLAVRGDAKAIIKKEVQNALDLVQLGALGKRRPHELSGGQRQRVALARAIVTKPRVLLLDEPLSALDKALRVDMQVELKRIQREVGITTIFVTHDQDEALTMSDRIGILRDGQLVQQGSPEQLYNHPETEFAARFLGDANIFELKTNGTGQQLKDGTQVLLTADKSLGFSPKKIAVRPERVTLSDPLTDKGPQENRLSGIVENTFFSGNTRMCHINWAGDTVRVLVPNDGRSVPVPGTKVLLSWAQESSIALKTE